MKINFQKYSKIVKFFIVFTVVLMTMRVFDVFAYVYNENPSTFGNFPKAGQLRVYYKDFLGGPGFNMLITKNGVSKSFSLPGYQGQTMLDTGIQVALGDLITVDLVEADADGGECVGWIAVQDNKCGSGLPDGNGGHYQIIDVSQWINWANQAGEPLVSRQCWGDWPEWSGDLDFEDFLLVFSYAPVPQPTVDLKANGSDGPITVAYQNRNSLNLSWTSQNADSCTASNDAGLSTWSGSKSPPSAGNQTISLSQVRTYTFTLTCQNNTSGNSASDSVQVTLLAPGAPVVVTKGVVVTY